MHDGALHRRAALHRHHGHHRTAALRAGRASRRPLVGRAVGSWPRRVLLLPRDLAELPGAAGPWMPEPRCSRSVRAMDRADPCSLVSRSRLDSPHLRVWSVSRGPWRDDLSSPRALPRRLCARSWSCGEGSEVGVVCTFGAKPFYEMARPWARPVPQRRVGASVEVARFLAAVTVRRCENVTHNASS